MSATKGSHAPPFAATEAFFLSGVGGCIDAIGVLTLGGLFVSHMSGNSAALGAAFGHGDWRTGSPHLFAVPLFPYRALRRLSLDLARTDLSALRIDSIPGLFWVCGAAPCPTGKLASGLLPRRTGDRKCSHRRNIQPTNSLENAWRDFNQPLVR
jgi:uncharacterized protein DUF1275